MKIIQVTKDNNPVIYKAFELLFETEKMIQRFSDSDECFCGPESPVWIVDTVSDSFLNRFEMFSQIANYSCFIRDSVFSTTSLYFIEHPQYKDNYIGFYGCGEFKTAYQRTAIDINKVTSKMLNIYCNYVTNNE